MSIIIINNLVATIEYSLIDQGFSSGGGGGGGGRGICFPLGFGLPPLGYAEHSILHVNQ